MSIADYIGRPSDTYCMSPQRSIGIQEIYFIHFIRPQYPKGLGLLLLHTMEVYP